MLIKRNLENIYYHRIEKQTEREEAEADQTVIPLFSFSHKQKIPHNKGSCKRHDGPEGNSFMPVVNQR